MITVSWSPGCRHLCITYQRPQNPRSQDSSGASVLLINSSWIQGLIFASGIGSTEFECRSAAVSVMFERGGAAALQGWRRRQSMPRSR
jgi:hypothetical protein